MQDIISGVVGATKRRFLRQVDDLIPADMDEGLSDLVGGKGSLTLRRMRKSARNFAGGELQKELAVHRGIQPWMREGNRILSVLSMSLKNQQHIAEGVTYYGAKFKRQSTGYQCLYLLCYF